MLIRLPYKQLPNHIITMSLVAEAPGFIQVFSDGIIKRFAPQTDQCSNISQKYKSKNVTIHPTKPILPRIFIPHHVSDPPPLLPVLLYFHGGGFCIDSTTWLGYHVFLGNLSATAQAIVLSVDYRLAPENKLPTDYDNCFSALEWLSSTSEPWLHNADLSSIFLSGDSASGNVANHVTIELMETSISNIRVKGLIPIHPFFESEGRTELEMEEKSAHEVAMNDMFWRLCLPEGSDRDFHWCNFENGEAEWGLFPAVVVFVAGMDFLKERGVMYAEFLKKRGVKRVSLIEAEEEKHVFQAWVPESEAACLLQMQMSTFMQSL